MQKVKMKKRTSNFAIFDRGAEDHIDALQVALLRASRGTILPELYEIFGKDKLLQFLDIFSGTTINIPSRKVLEDSIRDTYIYLGLRRASKKANRKKVMSDVAKDLADRYDIDKQTVWSVYEDMKKFCTK